MRVLKTRDKLNKFGIPFGYTRVEYLQSTGVQYIDTGIKANETTRLVANIDVQNNNSAFGVYGNFGFYRFTSSRAFYWGKEVYQHSESIRGWHRFDFSRQVILDNVLIHQFNESTFSSTKNIALFSLYFEQTDSYGDSFVGKISRVKIWDNGTLVRDFIPCIDPLGRPCMYDLVEHKTYYNQGTGEFTYGRQIIPVEYLESTETQYIDTGFALTANSTLDFNFSPNEQSGLNLWVCGSYITDTKLTGFRISSSTVLQGYIDNTSSISVSGSNIGKKYHCVMNSTNWSVNGTDGTSATQVASRCNLTIFGWNASPNTSSPSIRGMCSVKLYNFKILDNGVPVRDFIPCKDENGVGFMFDTVESKVYLNNGTGSFVVGEEAYDYKDTVRFLKDKIKYGLLSEYTRVEYIEAENNGNSVIQYAVSDYRLTNTTDWEITFSASSSGNNWVLGQPTWIGVHFRKDTSTSNLPRVGITNSVATASQCYVDYTENEKITLALKGTDVYANGVKAGSITRVSAPATQTKYGLFAYKDINQALPNLRILSARIYEIKIWDNSVLVQHLVPVLDSNGEGCFYDIVNKTVIRKEDNCTSDFTTGNMVYGLRLLAGGNMDDYIFLDYLESTGTQYIDTGVYPVQLTKAEIDIQFTSLEKCSVLGSNNGASADAGWNNLFGSNITGQITDKFWCQWGLNFGGNFTKDLNRHTHIFERNENTSWTYTVDTTSFTNSSGISTQPTNNQRVLYLFACNNNGTLYRQSYAKIYNCKIWNNNTIVRNFLPALRKSDNKPGMYDMVEGKFYVNQNTGADFNYGYKQ